MQLEKQAAVASSSTVGLSRQTGPEHVFHALWVPMAVWVWRLVCLYQAHELHTRLMQCLPPADSSYENGNSSPPAATQSRQDSSTRQGASFQEPFCVRNATLLSIIPTYCESFASSYHTGAACDGGASALRIARSCYRQDMIVQGVSSSPALMLDRSTLALDPYHSVLTLPLSCAPKQLAAAAADGVIDLRGRPLLELEDVAQQYHRPSIIDIKVGYQTWYQGAEEGYIQRCQAKDAATTQAALGFKVCGMQVGGRACQPVMCESPSATPGPCASKHPRLHMRGFQRLLCDLLLTLT